MVVKPAARVLAGLVLGLTSCACFSGAALSDSPAAQEEVEMQDNPPGGEDAVGMETVRIGEVEYPVPKPWLGRRLEAPPLGQPELAMLPREFTVEGSELYLRKAALAALVSMAEAALAEGVVLQADSTYRSARYQRIIFQRQLEEGKSFAEIARSVAPPGYSDHMLGTVVDFHPSDWRFAETQQYQWLRKHAGEYGFIETLPEHDKGGMPWEAWHWRYEGPLEGKGAN